ncbi:hypothetical protein [Amnibacterium sp.]|uniref:hypothetical protein n=1 Tax=Amnibacterium sp. TaxID=1872496 RepID=UPI003F7B5604
MSTVDAARARSTRTPVRIGSRLRSTWWARVVAIWLASRVVTTAIMLLLAAHERPTFWAPAHPGYFRLAQFWDSGWYHTIATEGYPASLPLDPSGHVIANAWAFLPAYPAVVNAVIAVTGIPWDVASVLVSAACSLGAALVFDRLLRALGRPAGFAVALFCFGPLSPLFQVAYAEAMAMLLLGGCLLLLVRRRYLTLIPVLLVADLTRPIGVPLAALIGIHVALRLLRRTADEPLRGRRLWSALAATAAAIGGAALWPVVAWLGTGDPSAYVTSELAWRRSHAGSGALLPFGSWVVAAERIAPGGAGIAVLVAVVAAFAALLVAVPAIRRLGLEIRLWAAMYGGYLLAVFDPQSSTFRLLLPLFPLLGGFGGIRSRLVRGALIALGVVLQFVWFAATWTKWHITGWSPP